MTQRTWQKKLLQRKEDREEIKEEVAKILVKAQYVKKKPPYIV